MGYIQVLLQSENSAFKIELLEAAYPSGPKSGLCCQADEFESHVCSLLFISILVLLFLQETQLCSLKTGGSWFLL